MAKTHDTLTNTKSNSGASSTQSSRHSLDPNSTDEIFVYRVRDGCSISSQKDLAAQLDSDGGRRYRCSSKPIPRGASRVPVLTEDLWSEEDRQQYGHYPNSKSSIASVGLPPKVYLKRMLMGQFQNLYIVSPDNSPASSANNSPQDNSPVESHNVTPRSTFPAEGHTERSTAGD